MKHLARRRLLAVQSSVVCQHRKGQQIQDDGVDYTHDEFGTEDEKVFSSLNVLLALTSTVTYAFDIFSSAAVCYYLFLNYAQEHDPLPVWWFILATVPLLISLVTVNCFSIRWYLHDMHEEKLSVDVSPTHWGLRIFFHLILLGPVLRYVELLCYGIHSMDFKDPKRQSYKVLVLQEDRDTSLLALVGSFIKSAPHLVLELYIMTQHKTIIDQTTTRAQIVAVISSVVTLSLSMTSYHRALRRSTPSKLNMTPVGSALQFISHFCIIGSRVIILAAFASVYVHWLFSFGLIHWGVMSVWLLYQRTTFCSSESGERRTCDELMFNVVMAAIYVFCFLNVKDEPTRWKYIFYYVIVWIENIILVVLWFVKANPGLWYRIPLLTGVLLGFATGVSVLGLYYKRFHPNKVSKLTTFVRVLGDTCDEIKHM